MTEKAWSCPLPFRLLFPSPVDFVPSVVTFFPVVSMRGRAESVAGGGAPVSAACQAPDALADRRMRAEQVRQRLTGERLDDEQMTGSGSPRLHRDPPAAVLQLLQGVRQPVRVMRHLGPARVRLVFAGPGHGELDEGRGDRRLDDAGQQ